MIVGVLVSKFADDMEQTGRTGQQRRLSCRLPIALNDCVRGFREFSRSVVSAMLCILSDA